MTLIRKDVQAETTNAPVGDVDVQKTNVWLGKCQYNIFNIYCPPASLVDIPLQDTHFKNTIILMPTLLLLVTATITKGEES